MATGLWKPVDVPIEEKEFLTPYEQISTNPEEFEGKSVLILGKFDLYLCGSGCMTIENFIPVCSYQDYNYGLSSSYNNKYITRFTKRMRTSARHIVISK